MFESQGTTPEPTQDSTTIAPVILTYEELQAKVELLENNLAFANSRVETAEAQLAERTRERNNWFDRYTSAQELIQESIDNGEWSDSELAEPFWERLAERLNLNIATERDITVTATWTLRVKTAKSYISDWDFNIADIESDTGEIEIISQDVEIDVSE